jgi:hypothetical protein
MVVSVVSGVLTDVCVAGGKDVVGGDPWAGLHGVLVGLST